MTDFLRYSWIFEISVTNADKRYAFIGRNISNSNNDGILIYQISNSNKRPSVWWKLVLVALMVNIEPELKYQRSRACKRTSISQLGAIFNNISAIILLLYCWKHCASFSVICKNIREGNQEMSQSWNKALPRHQKKERWRTNKDNTNGQRYKPLGLG